MRFSVIEADPPWAYAWRGNLATRFRGGMHQYYQGMKIEEICALPVADLAAENAMLFLWATMPKTTEYLPRVLAAWGFELSTAAFVWVKLSRAGNPLLGTGYYSKANAEPCWLARRKKRRPIKPAHDDVNQIILTRGRLRLHSEKPEETYERIERLYPDQTKIRLFHRRPRPGWVSLGNEIDGQDIRDSMRYWIDLPPEDFVCPGNSIAEEASCQHLNGKSTLLTAPGQASLFAFP